MVDADPDPEPLLGVLEQLGGAVEEAGDVGAHRHQVPADRLGVQHVVEGGGPPDLGRGHPDQLGDLLHRLGPQPAVLLLGQVAQRDEGRARLGVERHQLAGPGGHGRVEVAHRSTSPMHRVDRGDDGHRVGDQPAPQQRRQRLQVDEARAPDVHPVGLGGAVGDEVAAELAAGDSTAT